MNSKAWLAVVAVLVFLSLAVGVAGESRVGTYLEVEEQATVERWMISDVLNHEYDEVVRRQSEEGALHIVWEAPVNDYEKFWEHYRAGELPGNVARIVPEYELLPYDIQVGPELVADLSGSIELFGLGKNFTHWDHLHCTLLVDYYDYQTTMTKFYERPAYKGTLSGWFDLVVGGYDRVLCQDIYTSLTTLVERGESPIRFPDYDPAGVWALQLSFVPDGDEVPFVGGMLNVYIEHPDVYTIYSTPADLVVDIPIKE